MDVNEKDDDDIDNKMRAGLRTAAVTHRLRNKIAKLHKVLPSVEVTVLDSSAWPVRTRLPATAFV